MIYKLNNQNALTEGTIYLRNANVNKIRMYKFHVLEGETNKHGPRIKIMLKDNEVATYRVSVHNGNISLISSSINMNHRSQIEDVVREVSYGCYKLIYELSKNNSTANTKAMQYYTDMIVSAQRYDMHKVAERIRMELDGKIY